MHTPMQTLLAGVVDDERLLPFVRHLDDPAIFNRPVRVPSLGADHADYRADGGYWLGGVWPPTTCVTARRMQ